MHRTYVVLLLMGCGSLPHSGGSSIPRLRATASTVEEHGGVTVSIDPITSLNWKTFPEITARLSMFVSDSTQSVNSEAVGAPKVTLRFEDLLLMSLPAFRVRVSNQSEHALSFAHAHTRLADDQQHVDALTVSSVRDELDRQIHQRQNRQGTTINADQLSNVRAVFDDMPLLKPDRVVPGATDWRGYASFRFESEQPVTHLLFEIDGLELDGQPLPPFRFPFVVERRHGARACADGSAATPLGVCKNDENELSPAADGPCIQSTRVINNERGKQWWIGGDPIPNSDLHSTLMAHPDSAHAIRRGLWMRGFGYALILAGLGLVATTSVVFSQTYGSKFAPISISFTAVSLAGVGLAYVGSRRSEAAIRAYNEQADAGGACRVVY